MRYNLPIHNPLLKDVKAQYPHILHIASKSVERFEEKIHKPVPEDEIAYIAMHLGAAMERLRPYLGLKRRVLDHLRRRFCNSLVVGVTFASRISDIEVVEVTSALEIAQNPPQAGQVDPS